MRSHRFYSPIELIVGQSIQLPKEANHHCIQVLRYRVGSEVTLFNGDGFDYHAQISEINGKQGTVTVTSKENPANESPLSIHLFQGIARGEKMDLIIQKAVELGISQFTPIFTERCNVKLDNKRLEKKQTHWQKVATSASEQSGRAIIPVVNSAVNINKLKQDHECLNLYLEPKATSRVQDLPKITSLNLFVGPEGGFSNADLQALESLEIRGIQLGPRILRTETAGLASIAVLQSHFGDF
ncbi:16S rRNA (uracil(1498)-N(3))-methyltransferase [Aliikangiella coralliicola]|uniref:Ribosomal RNA small subunit methyltransferase E n=1 Tax=Aliikangiella coralliicola TaxID=2592383 RepID=A0A545UHU0_9GAMM|nr:16S rRNA (uracil(1498)-N(3))-methyltransferase [Aliikangiella coralliicola]TQV89036.1 16S rRNA (uracil(1498)-N(3))-methyltransferase [Aliikangiella coralliicola]